MTEKKKKAIIVEALLKYPGYLLLEALEFIEWRLKQEQKKIDKIASDIGWRDPELDDDIPF